MSLFFILEAGNIMNEIIEEEKMLIEDIILIKSQKSLFLNISRMFQSNSRIFTEQGL